MLKFEIPEHSIPISLFGLLNALLASRLMILTELLDFIQVVELKPPSNVIPLIIVSIEEV
jgi:hypothetical protein